MKPLLTITILLAFGFIGIGQKKKDYKEYDVCTSKEVYKGKKNHGKSYCVAWETIREYKDGRKDTVSGFQFATKLFIGGEYEAYQSLSERGKYIVDSLKEDGITQMQDMYLTYESMYMKPGKKIEKLWAIEGLSIIMNEYLIWNNGRGNGYELKKEYEVK